MSEPDVLVRLQRELRALGLTEHAGVWQHRGLAVARASLGETGVNAARVKRPSRNSPEWQPKTLRDAADLRDFVADLKKQLTQWSDRDD